MNNNISTSFMYSSPLAHSRQPKRLFFCISQIIKGMTIFLPIHLGNRIDRFKFAQHYIQFAILGGGTDFYKLISLRGDGVDRIC